MEGEGQDLVGSIFQSRDSTRIAIKRVRYEWLGIGQVLQVDIDQYQVGIASIDNLDKRNG